MEKAKTFEQRLVCLCASLSDSAGLMPALRHRLLSPMSIQLNAKDEFSRGVLSCVAEIAALLASTDEGRKALGDRFYEGGYQPARQHLDDAKDVK